jgi:hypothetical protein
MSLHRSHLALAAVGALLATGCGEGRLSRADFVSQTEQICQKVDLAAIKVGAPDKSAAETQAAARRLDPLLRRAADRLRALRPPQELADNHDSLVRNAEGRRRHYGQFAAALAHENQSAIQMAVLAIGDDSRRKAELARRMGLRGCLQFP